jgi:hypothetical protein
MRKVVTVLVLLLALSGPALAGDIPNPPVTTAPPPQKSASGDMLTPPAALIDALLSLLAVALP